MRKALPSLAVVLAIFLIFQACSPRSDFAKSRKILDAVVATPPFGYVAGEVSGGNWLNSSGNGHNLHVEFSKPFTTGSVASECGDLINWAKAFGATEFRDGQADGNIPLVALFGNRDEAQKACDEVLSLEDLDPSIEFGSAVWQMFGNFQSDGIPIGTFMMNVSHSYQQEADRIGLTHKMRVSFSTMLGESL